ncbi:hypothetical protein GHK66_14100 [Staphylococcus sciuri]|uniref:hypothetical protein n=1 Tax=Mammaliicoccus sciuri TaxID=1296 RepID=UPI0015E61CC2|nr:hypothetical protein [Mammaliicoccus sciuri]MBA1398116.1 hypothetical protein [Mammaliicoccus sciuri]
MAILGAILGAGASLLGSALNFGSQRQTNKQNMELAKYQYSQAKEMQNKEFLYNMDMWNAQNAYNHPTQQMQRLQQAGLNPNLVYGNGSVVGNTTSNYPQYKAPEYKAPHLTAPQFNFDPYQAVQFGQQLAMQKAQVNMLDAQTAKVEQETKNSALDNIYKTLQNAGMKVDVNTKQRLQEITIQQAIQTLQNSQTSQQLMNSEIDLNYFRSKYTDSQRMKLAQEIQNLRQDFDIKGFEYEMNKIGINTKDPTWQRILARILLASDNKVANWIKGLVGSRGATNWSVNDVLNKLYQR